MLEKELAAEAGYVTLAKDNLHIVTGFAVLLSAFVVTLCETT
jgi:hypothetical protein